MSTIARLFVFLNLVLSVAFLVCGIMLLQKSENYKGRYEGEVSARKSEVTGLQAQLTAKEGEVQEARKATENFRSELESVKVDRDGLKSQLSVALDTNSKNSGEIARIATVLENHRQNIDALQGQLSQANKDVDSMRGERDAARQAQDNAENLLAQAQQANQQLDAQVASLKESVNETSTSLTSAQTALEMYASRTGIPISEVAVAPPLITCNVVNVAAQERLVQLDMGSDGNVRKGYSFAIYSGSEYKGEAIVEDVQAKFATARITKLVPNKAVRAGDSATTRLW